MIRIGVIIILAALVFVLIRYRANQKVQKTAVISMISVLTLYIVSVVVTELLR